MLLKLDCVTADANKTVYHDVISKCRNIIKGLKIVHMEIINKVSNLHEIMEI